MSLRIAQKQALKSPHRQHRMGAVITKNGRILSTGYNEIRHSKTIGKNTLHAEASAIKKLLDARSLCSLIGSTMFVTRFTRGGRIGMAKPCVECASLIRSVGIRNVYYTDDSGNTQEWKP